MGVVYKAEDTKLERTVALKFLAAHLLNDEEAKERFLREAKAAAALHHPNVCPVYEIDEADGKTFLAMAFLEGESLEDRIGRGPLPLKDALEIGRQVAEGLAAAHGKGVVHRDIKPANILVSPEGRSTIMDFGLARLAEASKLTRADQTVGTAAYMSPEQIQGADADHRTDIWALGCVVYEMVTGTRAFPGEYAQALAFEIVNQEPEPVTGVRAGVPMELELFVGKCLAKDADDRYESASELAKDLRTLGEKLKSGRSTILQSTAGSTAGAPTTMTGAQTLNPAALPPDVVILPRTRLRALQGLAAVLAAVSLGLSVPYLTKAPVNPSTAVAANLTMDIAPAEMLGPAGFLNRPRATAFAISPDGSTVVFAGTGADGIAERQCCTAARSPRPRPSPSPERQAPNILSFPPMGSGLVSPLPGS